MSYNRKFSIRRFLESLKLHDVPKWQAQHYLQARLCNWEHQSRCDNLQGLVNCIYASNTGEHHDLCSLTYYHNSFGGSSSINKHESLVYVDDLIHSHYSHKPFASPDFKINFHFIRLVGVFNVIFEIKAFIIKTSSQSQKCCDLVSSCI